MYDDTQTVAEGVRVYLWSGKKKKEKKKEYLLSCRNDNSDDFAYDLKNGVHETGEHEFGTESSLVETDEEAIDRLVPTNITLVKEEELVFDESM